MIAIISPVYNVNSYLDDFFKSFLTFNKDDIEIIIIDDKGQENPEKIVKKYSTKLNIKYIKNKENLGLGFARNEGLKHISPESTHVMYIDSDDKVGDSSFIKDIKLDKITWFNNKTFDKVNENYEDKISSFGKNLFTNTIWGVSIPVSIAKDFKFESRYFEDMVVNRRLIKKFRSEIILSKTPAVSYRYRGSGINSSKPSAIKYRAFMGEVLKLMDEDLNTYRFNIQEIYQYYWMWKKYLPDVKYTELPKTKLRYRIAFWMTGNAIRFLKLEGLIYGRAKKNAFE